MLLKVLLLSFNILLACSFAGLAQVKKYVKASYYADKFHNRKTASGERYHKDSLTAAHRTLPFGTYVKVTNLKNNKTVIVKINDRGPMPKSRGIDLSKAAAKKLGLIGTGICNVKMEVCNAPPSENPFERPENNDAQQMAYAVQAGAFKERNNAEYLRQVLERKGFNDLHIAVVKNDDGELYRLMIGPYDNKLAAVQMLNRLKEINYAGFVVKI